MDKRPLIQATIETLEDEISKLDATKPASDALDSKKVISTLVIFTPPVLAVLSAYGIATQSVNPVIGTLSLIIFGGLSALLWFLRSTVSKPKNNREILHLRRSDNYEDRVKGTEMLKEYFEKRIDTLKSELDDRH